MKARIFYIVLLFILIFSLQAFSATKVLYLSYENKAWDNLGEQIPVIWNSGKVVFNKKFFKPIKPEDYYYPPKNDIFVEDNYPHKRVKATYGYGPRVNEIEFLYIHKYYRKFITFKYHTNMKVMERIRTYLYNDVFSIKFITKYDKLGRVIEKSKEEDEGGNIQSVANKYIYKGRALSLINSFETIGGVTTQIGLTKFYYARNGRLFKKEIYDWRKDADIECEFEAFLKSVLPVLKGDIKFDQKRGITIKNWKAYKKKYLSYGEIILDKRFKKELQDQYTQMMKFYPNNKICKNRADYVYDLERKVPVEFEFYYYNRKGKISKVATYNTKKLFTQFKFNYFDKWGRITKSEKYLIDRLLSNKVDAKDKDSDIKKATGIKEVADHRGYIHVKPKYEIEANLIEFVKYSYKKWGVLEEFFCNTQSHKTFNGKYKEVKLYYGRGKKIARKDKFNNFVPEVVKDKTVYKKDESNFKKKVYLDSINGEKGICEMRAIKPGKYTGTDGKSKQAIKVYFK